MGERLPFFPRLTAKTRIAISLVVFGIGLIFWPIVMLTRYIAVAPFSLDFFYENFISLLGGALGAIIYRVGDNIIYDRKWYALNDNRNHQG